MTTDTLNRHIANYRAGSISLKDHGDMVEELVTRRERQAAALEKVELAFDNMRDEFVASIESED